MALPVISSAQQRPGRVQNGFLRERPFLQISGPNPILTPGPSGSWDSHVIEAGDAFKDFGTYYLYYHATEDVGGGGYQTGVATSTHPLGPFTKFGDQPILPLGPEDSWDGRHAACAMVLKEGTDRYLIRILTRESIGYASSRDGINWTKYSGNPVATREAEPNAAAYAEVHAIVEPPFIYLYHTLRYKQPWRDRFRDQFPTVEDLGMQVLVMARPFRLDMPALTRETLAAGTTTSMRRDESPIIALSHATSASVTVQCTYDRRDNVDPVISH
jgi:hypothetical protein